MTLARLTLSDFRNHASARIDAAPGFIVLVGENGAGKTNVLEAVSLLVPGRGLRGAAASDMARHGGSGAFGIAAELADGTTLSTGTLVPAPDRR
ncbi:MAG TPA: AAA family ATPase, partial [Chakrabartia sp.]|nr:AAA family ATPase [Chakrabartia sp.]